MSTGGLDNTAECSLSSCTVKTFLCALLGSDAFHWRRCMTDRRRRNRLTLLNVSYDVTREVLPGRSTPLFVKDWKSTKQARDVTIAMSHGGSTMQSHRSVLDGLDADVVTMNQDTDLDLLAGRARATSSRRTGARSFRITAAFRTPPPFCSWCARGNPKGIKDWDDLVQAGRSRLVVSNPKTSGNGRYSYLAAWGYALRKSGGNDAMAKDFVGRLFKNVVALDKGGRAATTSFAGRGIGDVLLTFENEVYTIKNDPALGGSKCEPVVPSLSIRADPPVAVVDPNVEQHGTRAVAEAYLRFLFTPAAQELMARNFLRPVDPEALARHADLFKPVELIDVQTAFGGWAKAQKVHFDDGGILDQIYAP